MPIQSARDGPVGIVSLDRPEKAHAYDRALLVALQAAFTDAESLGPVVVITATGDGAFCGGADLDELSRATPIDALDLFSQRIFDQIASSPAITICAVGGPAVGGGCELALAADVRIVGPRARFRLPETGMGILPAAGGCTRLARLIGVARAKAVILAGQEIDSRMALDWGLALEIADDPQKAAIELGHVIAQRDPSALRMAKAIIDRTIDPSSLAAERNAQALLYDRTPRTRLKNRSQKARDDD